MIHLSLNVLERTLLALALALLMVAGVVINALFLYLHHKKARLRCHPCQMVTHLLSLSSASNSSARGAPYALSTASCVPKSSFSLTKGNTYTSNLNVAGLMTCCTAIPASIAYVVANGQSSGRDVIYLVTSASYSLCINASNLIVMLISLDRIYAVTNPFKESWTSRLSTLCVVVLWTISIASSVVPFFEWDSGPLKSSMKTGRPCVTRPPPSGKEDKIVTDNSLSNVFNSPQGNPLDKSEPVLDKNRLDMPEQACLESKNYIQLRTLFSIMTDFAETRNRTKDSGSPRLAFLIERKTSGISGNESEEPYENNTEMELVRDMNSVCLRFGRQMKLYSFKANMKNVCSNDKVPTGRGTPQNWGGNSNDTYSCLSECSSLNFNVDFKSILKFNKLVAILISESQRICSESFTSLTQLFDSRKISFAIATSNTNKTMNNVLVFDEISIPDCLVSNLSALSRNGQYFQNISLCGINTMTKPNAMDVEDYIYSISQSCSSSWAKKTQSPRKQPQLHFITEVLSFASSLVCQLIFMRTISRVAKKKKQMANVSAMLPAVTMAVAQHAAQGLSTFGLFKHVQQQQQQQPQQQQQQQQQQRNQRQRRKTIDVANITAPMTQAGSPCLLTTNNFGSSSQRRNMMKVSTLIILAYVITFGPHVIVALVAIISDENSPILAHLMTQLIAFCAPCLNPFIYTFLRKQVRVDFMRLHKPPFRRMTSQSLRTTGQCSSLKTTPLASVPDDRRRNVSVAAGLPMRASLPQVLYE